MNATLAPPAPTARPYTGYRPNFSMYSKPPAGFHDEPFEYVFSFQQTFSPSLSNPRACDLLNQPLHLDPDADFYIRGMAILIDPAPPAYVGGGRIDYNMRLRDPFGRPLDNAFIPMQAYATPVNDEQAVFPPQAGSFEMTPVYPEIYGPANSFLIADFQAQGASGGTFKIYSFHLYFAGVKRLQNADCLPVGNQ